MGGGGKKKEYEQQNSPFPVIIKSFELDSQNFWQFVYHEPFNSIYL